MTTPNGAEASMPSKEELEAAWRELNEVGDTLNDPHVPRKRMIAFAFLAGLVAGHLYPTWAAKLIGRLAALHSGPRTMAERLVNHWPQE